MITNSIVENYCFCRIATPGAVINHKMCSFYARGKVKVYSESTDDSLSDGCKTSKCANTSLLMILTEYATYIVQTVDLTRRKAPQKEAKKVPREAHGAESDNRVTN